MHRYEAAYLKKTNMYGKGIYKNNNDQLTCISNRKHFFFLDCSNFEP
jgi:hypothetical protein